MWPPIHEYHSLLKGDVKTLHVTYGPFTEYIAIAISLHTAGFFHHPSSTFVVMHTHVLGRFFTPVRRCFDCKINMLRFCQVSPKIVGPSSCLHIANRFKLISMFTHST